mmetsp:Transcript_6118/g.9537  ORF Transcript_6118/g.9537 Transcript_6118/m.9537 type:complete len:351 (-) Transcript_6118:24-1076(-)
MKMKAVVVEATGGVEVLQFKNCEASSSIQCSSKEALIKNEYAGLNFIDTYHRSGLYPRDCPFILGQEGGGVVEGLPNDPDAGDLLEFKIGDRVVYGAFGSYAEYTSVPLDKLVPVPDDMEMKTAIACMTQGLTAHYLSSSVGAGIAKEGDWVLVYGVGSGTGQWTSQMCKLRGYKVIGTTSQGKVIDINNAKSAFGCDELIVLDNATGKSYADYTSVDIVSKVMDITNGQGCKLIIDGIGKDTYEISLKCLAKRGLFVSFGNASGRVPAFPVLRLLPQSAYMTRPKLNDFVATREELLQRASDVFSWVKEGKLNIVIDKVFDLEEVRAAHEYLENGGSKGKVLLEIKSPN